MLLFTSKIRFWFYVMAHKASHFLARLGYQFKQNAMLEAALTHRSVPGDNNERLEFLGDSIVNFLIAEALYIKFPQAREGELSRLRANFVCGGTLAELARELELGTMLRLGPGELKNGGHRRESILADSMEAVIAAIYLDGGLECCRALVLKWFASRLQDVTLSHNLKDPKTRLQEYLQAKKFPLPSYTIARTEGDAHNQIFHIQCRVEGLSVCTDGSGTSRRRAEQEAAAAFLDELRV